MGIDILSGIGVKSTPMETFLFADLVGFTALTAERGDEDAADIALRLFAFVRPLLGEHHAEEIKTMGDGMMLRCADPGLAVALGVRISAGSLGIPPVRVGIHTGSAVCRDGDWYGGGVNVASRLCSAAGGGEVLVSNVTRSLAGEVGGVELGGRRMHWLKNVPEPVIAWHAATKSEAPAMATTSTVACRSRRPRLPRLFHGPTRPATT